MVHQWFLFTRTNAARNDYSLSPPWSLPAKGVTEFSENVGRKPIQVHLFFELSCLH